MGNRDQEQSELLIDANVILEFLLARQRQEESLALLKLISTGEVTAWVMSYAVHSIEYMLYREGDLTALRNFLQLLRSSLWISHYEIALKPNNEYGKGVVFRYSTKSSVLASIFRMNAL